MHPNTHLVFSNEWLTDHDPSWWSGAYTLLNRTVSHPISTMSASLAAIIPFKDDHGLAICTDFSALFYKEQENACHFYPDPICVKQHHKNITLYTQKDSDNVTKLRLRTSNQDLDWEDEKVSQLRVSVLLEAAHVFSTSTFAPLASYGASIETIRPWQNLEAPTHQVFTIQEQANYMTHLIGNSADIALVFPNFSSGIITPFSLHQRENTAARHLLACLNDTEYFNAYQALFGPNGNPTTLRIKPNSTPPLSAHDQIALRALVQKHMP